MWRSDKRNSLKVDLAFENEERRDYFCALFIMRAVSSASPSDACGTLLAFSKNPASLRNPCCDYSSPSLRKLRIAATNFGQAASSLVNR